MKLVYIYFTSTSTSQTKNINGALYEKKSPRCHNQLYYSATAESSIWLKWGYIQMVFLR